MKTHKLTTGLLKRIIAEEKKKLGMGEMQSTEDAAKETDEVDASEYADSLAQDIDYMKALKIKEARIVAQLKSPKLNEASRRDRLRRMLEFVRDERSRLRRRINKVL